VPEYCITISKWFLKPLSCHFYNRSESGYHVSHRIDKMKNDVTLGGKQVYFTDIPTVGSVDKLELKMALKVRRSCAVWRTNERAFEGT